MATDKKQFSLIEPADEVPDKKGYKQAKYIEIFNEFFESGPKRQR